MPQLGKGRCTALCALYDAQELSNVGDGQPGGFPLVLGLEGFCQILFAGMGGRADGTALLRPREPAPAICPGPPGDRASVYLSAYVLLLTRGLRFGVTREGEKLIGCWG